MVVMLTTTIIMMTTMIMITITTATEEDNKQQFRMCWYLPATHRRAHSYIPCSSSSVQGSKQHSTLRTLPALHRSSASASFTLVSCVAYYSTMKIEAICSSETSVDVQQTTWCYIPEDRTLEIAIIIGANTVHILRGQSIPRRC
jgi:hypothetical protein